MCPIKPGGGGASPVPSSHFRPAHLPGPTWVPRHAASAGHERGLPSAGGPQPPVRLPKTTLLVPGESPLRGRMFMELFRRKTWSLAVLNHGERAQKTTFFFFLHFLQGTFSKLHCLWRKKKEKEKHRNPAITQDNCRGE